MRGLEPPRLAAQPPQDCVYTSFTTSASSEIISSSLKYEKEAKE